MAPLKDLIPTIIKDKLKKKLHLYDIILNQKAIDFRNLELSPLEALERASGYNILMDFEGKICRGMRVLGFPLNQELSHPFVMTASEYLDGKATQFSDSSLLTYYDKFQPKNAAELLGLESQKAPKLLEENLRIIKFPWESPPNKRDFKKRKRKLNKEYQKASFKLTWKDGDPLFGPINHKKGEFEFSRIKSLVDSIKNFGYVTEKQIPGTLLVKGDEYRIVINTGQHRAAVLASLKRNIPILIDSRFVVSRDNALYWPWVQYNYVSKATALEIFDRIFEGEQPEALKKVWQP